MALDLLRECFQRPPEDLKALVDTLYPNLDFTVKPSPRLRPFLAVSHGSRWPPTSTSTCRAEGGHMMSEADEESFHHAEAVASREKCMEAAGGRPLPCGDLHRVNSGCVHPPNRATPVATCGYIRNRHRCVCGKYSSSPELLQDTHTTCIRCQWL